MKLWSIMRHYPARPARMAAILAALLLGAATAPAANPKWEAAKSAPGGGKISHLLVNAGAQAKSQGKSLGDLLGAYPILGAGTAQIEVIVRASAMDKALLDAITAAGGDVLWSSVNEGTARVGVDGLDTLAAIAALGPVDAILPAYAPRTRRGSVDGLADEAHRVNAAQIVGFGVDGTGVLVGILSDSFAVTNGVRNTGTTVAEDPVTKLPVLRGTNNQLSGDLPEIVYLLKDGRAGSTDEGAGMAELVYDIAPGAGIAFHTVGGSELEFAEAIDKLAALPFANKVLVDDVIFLAEPVYQVGPVQAAAARAVAAGTPFFSAQGNNGDQAIRTVYTDVNPSDNNTVIPPNGADLHRWPNGSGFLPITLQPGAELTAVVQWNQPWRTWSAPDIRGSQVDLDVYLTRTPDAAGLQEATTFQAVTEGRYSREVQGFVGFPAGDPFEIVSYRNNRGVVETVYLAIDHFDGAKGTIPQMDAPLELSVIFFGDFDAGITIPGVTNTTAFDLRGPVNYGHGTDVNVVAVGAVNFLDTPEFDTTFGPTNEIDPESFTARGGVTRQYFDVNGVAARVESSKPDLSAVNGNSTTFFGGADIDLDGAPNFFGTSAAAPNAAAIAALMLNLNRNLTPSQVRAAMVATAIDIRGRRAAPGIDDVSGAGLIDGLAALRYVRDTYGTTAGPAAPSRLVYEFNGGNPQGWAASGAIGRFTAPGNSASGGALNLTASNTVDTFGWWISPEIVASANEVGGGVASIAGTAGPGTIFRLTADVGSTAAAELDTPSFRLRQQNTDFERASELVVSTVGAGTIAPSASSAKIYRQYFSLPPANSRFRSFFEILGFDPADAAGTTISLRDYDLIALPARDFYQTRLESLQFFRGNDRSWTTRSIAAFPAVPGRVTAEGIEIGPVPDPRVFSFGSWSSPVVVASMDQGRVYRATFRLRSNLPAEQRDRVPTFRLRMNSGDFQLAVVEVIESRTTTSTVPAGGVAEDYQLFWEVPAPLAGQPAYLSLDYLYFPGEGNDPTTRLTLESLRVDSMIAPEPL